MQSVVSLEILDDSLFRGCQISIAPWLILQGLARSSRGHYAMINI